MTPTRRRFLTITAAIAATPTWAGQETWQGQAFGGDVRLTIRGPRDPAQSAIRTARHMLREIEGLFNLFDPSSALNQLNQTGKLLNPDDRFTRLMQSSDRAYVQTNGLFDPTVQPFWQALADGHGAQAAKTAIGWSRVHFNANEIILGQGQALTFNGIAQGFATDLITDHLRQSGLTQGLVNMGEYKAIGGPFRLGLSDPTFGHMGTRTIRNSAIATSSPAAMALGAQSHILHPTEQVKWSTVSVEAATATQADYLSTALCLAPYDHIVELAQGPEISRITLVDFDGNLKTL